MAAELKLVTTADGSSTIWNEEVGEHYHSKHGAFQESRHVFLQSGLQFFIEKSGKDQVKILEVGFGTGLNFLLTSDFCTSRHINLQYTGLEANPLSPGLISQTGYNRFVTTEIWNSFTLQYPTFLERPAALNDYCQLRILPSRLQEYSDSEMYDVIYFDAFAAVHQPEMWTPPALERCCSRLLPGGVFVTYAITGNLKRTMKELGFKIEKAPGAPGKREMLRAIKL